MIYIIVLRFLKNCNKRWVGWGGAGRVGPYGVEMGQASLPRHVGRGKALILEPHPAPLPFLAKCVIWVLIKV